MPAYEPSMVPPGRTNVYGEAVYKATLAFGASVLATYWGKDLTIVRTSAGKYTITLPRTYRRRCGVKFGWGKCAAGAVIFPVVLTDSSATASSTGGGTIVIETRTEAGVATDPANGDQLDIELSFSLEELNDTYDTAI